MPELPDVETMRRRLDADGLRRPIARVLVRDRYVLHGLSPATLDGALRGRRLTGTRRHGKYLFARAEDGPWLLLHFGMTGGLAIESPARPAPRNARVTLRFIDGGALHFVDQRKLGRVGLVDDPGAFVVEKRLGPDALDAALTARAFGERLAAHRGVLKGLLLDQHFVAGLGNIYADEVCLQAHIAPLSPVEHLSAEDRRALFGAMRSVLRTAIDREADARRLPEDWLLHQRRADGVCLACGGPISRARYQGRYTYWCPSCQRER